MRGAYNFLKYRKQGDAIGGSLHNKYVSMSQRSTQRKFSIIGGNEIDDVQCAKLLGVTISSDLRWNKHVESIVAKAGKRVYMLYQLKRAGIGQHDLVTMSV